MRKLLFAAVAFSTLALQGCFPVVATGVGTGLLMAEDRRTSGTFIEDQAIELKTSSRVDEKFKDQVHVNVTSFDGNVLLTGEVPTEADKQGVAAIAQGVPKVTRVTNELAVAGKSSLTSRSNDAYITSKIKARFIDANKFQANHVKVVTENGVVYLMGLVKHKEAEDATEIASTTGGVQKVVKIFEYMD